MIPDIQVDNGAWLDLRSVGGVPASARLLIQNKGKGRLTIWEGNDIPPDGLFGGIDGLYVYPNNCATTGTGKVFIYCGECPGAATGRIHVQEYLP